MAYRVIKIKGDLYSILKNSKQLETFKRSKIIKEFGSVQKYLKAIQYRLTKK